MNIIYISFLIALFLQVNLIYGLTEILIPADEKFQSGVYSYYLNEHGDLGYTFLHRSLNGVAKVEGSSTARAVVVVFDIKEWNNLLRAESPPTWVLFSLGSASGNFTIDVRKAIISAEKNPILSLFDTDLSTHAGSFSASSSSQISLILHDEIWEENDSHVIVGFFPHSTDNFGHCDIQIESCALRIKSEGSYLNENFRFHLYPYSSEIKAQIFGVWRGAGAADGFTYKLESSADLENWLLEKYLFKTSNTWYTNFSSRGISLGVNDKIFLRIVEQ